MSTENPLEQIESFDFEVPALVANDYQPSRIPVNVGVSWLERSEGPGGIRVYSNLDQSAALLGVLKDNLNSLPEDQQQRLKDIIGPAAMPSLANAVENAANYILYLKDREQTISNLLNRIAVLSMGA